MTGFQINELVYGLSRGDHGSDHVLEGNIGYNDSGALAGQRTGKGGGEFVRGTGAETAHSADAGKSGKVKCGKVD